MCVYLVISVLVASRMNVWCGKNFNIVIFSNSVKVINVKFCLVVLLIELYLFIPLSVILTILQGHLSVKQFFTEHFMILPSSVEIS